MPTYASKYYDPEKAHEYYMKHRELKGYENRYGGSRGDGTSAASEAYYQKTSDVNQRVRSDQDTIKSKHETDMASLREELDAFNKSDDDFIEEMNTKIKGFRKQLASLSKEEKESKGEELRDRIYEFQEMVREARASRVERRRELDIKVRDAKQAQADEKQRLRQQVKGGSTSGFNEKGKAAAEYIKTKMESEKKELLSKMESEKEDLLKKMKDDKEESVKKIKEAVDKAMLGKVEMLKARFERMRSSGRPFNPKQVMGQINSLLGEVKKTKAKKVNEEEKSYKTKCSELKDSYKTKSAKLKDEYKVKYKEEIDKLRDDDSMFTYWDKRAEKLAKQSEKDAQWTKKSQERTDKFNARENERRANYSEQKAKRAAAAELRAQKKAEREAKKAEREARKASRRR